MRMFTAAVYTIARQKWVNFNSIILQNQARLREWPAIEIHVFSSIFLRGWDTGFEDFEFLKGINWFDFGANRKVVLVSKCVRLVCAWSIAMDLDNKTNLNWWILIEIDVFFNLPILVRQNGLMP